MDSNQKSPGSSPLRATRKSQRNAHTNDLEFFEAAKSANIDQLNKLLILHNSRISATASPSSPPSADATPPILNELCKEHGNYKGRGLIHVAAGSGNKNVLEWLLENGSEVDLVDKDGHTAIYSAAKYRRRECIELLLDNNCSVVDVNDATQRTVIHSLAAQGRMDVLQMFVDHKPELANVQDKAGQSPLFSAVKYSKKTVIEYLLAKGASIDVVGKKDKRSVLHNAAASGDLEIFSFICNYIAKNNPPNKSNNSNNNNNTPSTDALTSALDRKDFNGQSCIFSAIKYRHNKVVEYILKVPEIFSQWSATIDLDIQDKNGDTPLHFASQQGIYTIVEALLAAGASTELENKEGQLAADVATGKGIKSLISKHELIQRGLSLSRANSLVKDDSEEVGSPTKKMKVSSEEENSDKTFLLKSNSSGIPSDSDKEAFIRSNSTSMTFNPVDAYDQSTIIQENTLPVPDEQKQNNHNNNNNQLNNQQQEANRISLKDHLALDDFENNLLRTWEIKFSEISLKETLGAGAFGVVKRGQWKYCDVAVKLLHHVDPDSLKMFIKEMRIMTKIRHINCVMYLGACIELPHVAAVMEFLPQNLSQLIKSGPIEIPTLIKIARGIASGIHHLHSFVKIIHRDIKPSNILLTESLIPKIADFGISKDTAGAAAATQIGTPDYMAPEILRGGAYGPAIDVFSYGLLVYCMLTGKKPFHEYEVNKDVNPLSIALKVAFDKIRPTIPSTTPLGLAQLIRDCWEDDPTKRLSMEDVLKRFDAQDLSAPQ